MLFDNNEEKSFEPDPATVAHLDQEGAAFDEMQDQFEEMFGFRHKCKCAEDYSSGNIVEVTECFTNMVNEALESCQTLVQENLMLRTMLTQIFQAVEAEASTEPVDGGQIVDDFASDLTKLAEEDTNVESSSGLLQGDGGSAEDADDQ